MRFLTKLATGFLLVSVVSPVAAKIYPYDFMTPGQTVPTSSSSGMSSSATPVRISQEVSEPFFFASEIPAGNLTRSQFVDAIATRLYDADAHDRCFAELVLSEAVNYNLLFNDVSLDAPYASSVCVSMRNGIAQGYSDYTFRPGKPITVAEAAAMFGGIGGLSLRDSNHVQPGEPWYQRFMDAMRAVDREFTMRPGDILTGRQLEHSLCVLKRGTSELDPLREFTGC